MTWSQVNSLSATSLTVVALDKSKVSNGVTSTIYAGVNTTTGPSVYVSKDAGVTWNAVTGAPTGLALSAKGAFAWAKAVKGIYALTVTATDALGLSGSGTYTLTVR